MNYNCGHEVTDATFSPNGCRLCIAQPAPRDPRVDEPKLRLFYTTRTGRITFDETAEPRLLLALLAARVKGWEVGRPEQEDT